MNSEEIKKGKELVNSELKKFFKTLCSVQPIFLDDTYHETPREFYQNYITTA